MRNFVDYDNAEDLFEKCGQELNKRLLQCSSMPTASASLLGIILQYIGATNETFENGHFYKCILDNETYRWIEILNAVPTFTGTTQQWTNLSLAEKLKYEIVNITDDLGAEIDVIDSVVDGDMRPVTSNAVHDYVDNKISGAYQPAGSKTCAELVSSLLISTNVGKVYNTSDSGTTTSDFVEGAGKTIEIGDNVVIVDVGTQNNATYKFDLLSGMIDLSNYIQKSSTSGFVKNDGSIDTTNYQPTESGKGLSTNDYTTAEKNAVATIGNKADKVASVTSGNLAGLNASGNLTDSGWASDKTTTSVSGNPISIPNLKSNQLAIDPVITYNPIQDLHGQNKPYPAGGGTNLLNLATKASTSMGGVVYQCNADNTLIASGTGSAEYGAAINIDVASPFTLKSGQAYTVSIQGTISFAQSNVRIKLYPSGQSGLEFPLSAETSGRYSGSLTPSSDIYVEKLNLQIAQNKAVNLNVKVQVEKGSSSSAYAPYENICPISGYDKIEVLSCGHNLWDEEWELGRFNPENGAKINDKRIRSVNFIPVVSGENYFLLGELVVIYYDAGQNFISGAGYASGTVITIPNGCKYIKICTGNDAYGNVYKNDISINYPSTDISYHASNKTTDLSESLGQTVYGGSLDVRTGKFTATYKSVDMGDLNWSYGSNKFYADIQDKKVGVSTLVCSVFSYVANKGYAVESNTISDSNAATQRVFVYDSRYYPADSSNVDTFKTAVIGQKLVYKLEIPFTIQLAPHEISLLKDYAYVSTNGTNIAFDYHNGEMASLADVSQLGETVNELGEYVDANNLGSLVTIPESEDFIIPSDGYIRIKSGSGSGDFYRVDIYGSKKVASNRAIMKINSSDSVASKYQYLSLYVRKGMIAVFGEKNTGNTTGEAIFIPLE